MPGWPVSIVVVILGLCKCEISHAVPHQCQKLRVRLVRIIRGTSSIRSSSTFGLVGALSKWSAIHIDLFFRSGNKSCELAGQSIGEGYLWSADLMNDESPTRQCLWKDNMLSLKMTVLGLLQVTSISWEAKKTSLLQFVLGIKYHRPIKPSS